MRGDGDGWAFGDDGRRHWGRYGAAGLLLRAPGDDGRPRVLLQHRAGWSHEGGTWSIPGGARDSHEGPVEAAVREAGEECGLPAGSINVRADVRTAGEPATWTYTTVVADAADRLATTANRESVELTWIEESRVGAMALHSGFAEAWPGLRTRPLRLIVDMANLVGSRPDGWWRDRVGAAERMLDALEAGLPRTMTLRGAGGAAGGFGWTTQVIAVVEGKAKAVGERGAADGAGTSIDLERAPGSGDDTIAACAHGVWGGITAVVTADRGLQDRLPDDAVVIAPRRVLEWV